MVTAAQAGKAPVQRLADKISGVFVPVVLVLSAATLAGWLLTGHSPQAAFTAAVAVLVIACPCALGLATPTALLVGSGRAAQLGVVIKGPEVLESTRALDTMVMDKTGTVTQGRMSLDVEACREVGGADPASSQAPDAAGPVPLGQESLRLAGAELSRPKQRLRHSYLVMQDVNHQLFGESVDADAEFLVVGSTWHSEFAAVDPALMAYVDEHNSTMYAPRVMLSSFDDGAVCLQADMTAFTGEGMSDVQLQSFLNSSFTTLLSFYETAADDLSAFVVSTEED